MSGGARSLWLEALLFPNAGARRPVVVSGMAGVGKSYLVDRFYWDHQEKFPGGYLRLSLDPEKLVSAAELIAQLADRLKLPVGDAEALRNRLLAAPSLVHIENADTPEAGPRRRRAGGQPARMRGRDQRALRGLGVSAGWGQVELKPFDEATALRQLAAELGDRCAGAGGLARLAAALGFLPLALHLAAGYLREGDSAASFLRRLRQRGLALEHPRSADPLWEQRSRALISDTFELSLAALTRSGGDQGAAWRDGFAALGHAPAAGFGASLGAAIAGLDADAFDDMVSQARRLSLLDRVARGAGAAYRLHPLLAELVRGASERRHGSGPDDRMVCRASARGRRRPGAAVERTARRGAALTEWLGQVPEVDRVRVVRAGSQYAIRNGPYHAWLRFCEETLAGGLGEADRSDVLWTLGNVALRGGLPDRALAAAERKICAGPQSGADREAALAAGLIADILGMRGDLDGALRIRREEELPVFERLGDAR